MHLAANDMFIRVLRNAACAAAHQADLAVINDDPETVHSCIEAAYAALDQMFERQHVANAQFPTNDNATDIEAIEAIEA